MTKAVHKPITTDPAIMTVGELIDQLCRLPDTAVVSFRCPMLEQELTFHRLRKRSKDIVEIEVQPEGPPIVPSNGGSIHARKPATHPPSHREGAHLQKARG
jgi:hypothetical protein